MKFKKISVDFRQVSTLDEMHEALSKVFHFPDFYGKNVNALIDCLSSLRFPEDEMTGITVDKNELVLLEVKGMHHLDQIMINHFIIAIEDVNKRSMMKMEQQPLILLLPV